ncbi:MAG: NAD-dependent epimerase/dehydratase family protein [Methanomicrobiales archaeon]|nr:NAD-dependent epimerase/dehydratase family protein [Methanomicrobiales archaeon]
MRILVTGAGGLAGRAMVRHLLGPEGDREVTGIFRRNLPPPSDRFTPVKLDLLDREKTLARVREAEPGIILHLAGVNHGTLEELLGGNVVATRNLLDAACALRVPPRVLVTGSSSEYGYAGAGPIAESAPLRPVGPYGVSKAAEDLLARSYAAVRQLPVAVIRPFNLIGPGQPETYLCGKIARQVTEIEEGRREEIALADLVSRRDFVDVRDLARACRDLAGLPDFGDRCAGLAFNAGSGKDHSVAEVLDLVRKITGKRYPVLLPEKEPRIAVPSQRSDNSLITATCGWRPAISLTQSLRDMLAYERDRVR